MMVKPMVMITFMVTSPFIQGDPAATAEISLPMI
jgi:hypothetical protein